MRKVLFKRWIGIQYEEVKGKGYTSPKPGTNCWGPMENKGLFHCWGLNSTEAGETVATDSVAIVELEDGSVERVAPESIQFVS